MSDENSPALVNERTAAKGQVKAKRQHSVPLLLRLMRLGFRVGGTLSPHLAGRAAYRFWLTPTRFRMPASERGFLESAESSMLEIQSMDIATYSWGDSGPAVLLVHGWSGRGTQLGAFVEPLVEAGFRVLSFDCPAHGRSSGKQTNLYEISDVILALDEHFGPFESVITHSFGGPCLADAMQRGLSTVSVVSISPPAKVDVLVDKFADTLSIPEKARHELVERFELAFGSNILEAASMQNNVRGLDTPALVIHDQDDADIEWQQGAAVARAWNNARFIKTSSLGHRRILRDPSTIAAAVSFIEQQQKPPQ